VLNEPPFMDILLLLLLLLYNSAVSSSTALRSGACLRVAARRFLHHTASTAIATKAIPPAKQSAMMPTGADVVVVCVGGTDGPLIATVLLFAAVAAVSGSAL
jgi:hypothetical protein